MILIIVSWIQKHLTAEHNNCKILIEYKSYIICLSKICVNLYKYRKACNQITTQGIVISCLHILNIQH